MGRWLEMLEVKVPGALVLPVLTHLDHYEQDVDAVCVKAKKLLEAHLTERERRLRVACHDDRKAAPKHKPLNLLLDQMLAISSRAGTNLKALQRTLLEIIPSMPRAGQILPVYYSR